MTQHLRVAELDFDTIKANIREFIASKPGFTDYLYEGSGLSILMDVLAYNTHYNAVIANMMVPEMFLDTAVKRITTAQHAKRMGYLPRSIRAARALVNVEIFPDDTPATITIERNSSFSSTGKLPFDFLNRDAITVKADTNGRYIFNNIELFEGKLHTFSYVVGSSTSQNFIIPHLTADMSTLRVSVQKSVSNTERTTWNFIETIADVNRDTTGYYLKMNHNGLYEVYFGDGVLGKKIETGNVIILEYVVCSGEIPNGAYGFKLNGTVQGYINNLTTTLNTAFGGAQEESIQSIKDNAYRRQLSQNRAVSPSDYISVINDVLPVGDVNVWGGEDNIPPVYGKVFISAIPVGLSTTYDKTTKEYIMSHLKRKMTMTLVPEIVDPEYIYIKLDTVIYYNPNLTSDTKDQLKTYATNMLINYSTDNFNKFGCELRRSKLGAYIDSTDKSITSNVTKIYLNKEIQVALSYLSSYTIKFNVPIIPGTVATNAFTSLSYENFLYLDDLNGTVRAYSYVNGNKAIIFNAGTVDYDKGIIKLDPLTITGYFDEALVMFVTPVNDVIAINNDVLKMSTVDINVTVLEDTPSNHIYTV